MDVVENLKTVKEVFVDFNTIGKELPNAKLKEISFFKKTNTLNIVLYNSNLIDIKDLYGFEKYLGLRFSISNINIKLEKEEVDQKETIDEIIKNNWNDLIDYLSYKHPMTKAILKDSNIEIEDQNINVLLTKKGKDFLNVKKFDDILSNIIFNFYGIKYKIKYIEDITSEKMNEYRKQNEELEKEIIKKVSIENTEVKNNNEISNNSDLVNVEGSNDNSSNLIDTEEEYLKELEEKELEKDVILGKMSKAKDTKVTIKEISVDNKRISLEGRIMSCDARETKTGKGMLIFELFDGTGIITCKSFTAEIKEANEVCEKIKKASGIKVIGKASLDTYVNDVTVMANVILEINDENLPKLPTEDNDSPLIYGMNMEIVEPLVKIENLSVDSRKCFYRWRNNYNGR